MLTRARLWRGFASARASLSRGPSSRGSGQQQQRRQAQNPSAEADSGLGSPRSVLRPLAAPVEAQVTQHVAAFGSNLLGHLGVEDVDQGGKGLVIVDSLEGKQIRDVASAWTMSAALAGDNQIYSWGCNQQVRYMVRKQRRMEKPGLVGTLSRDWSKLFDNSNAWRPLPLDMSAVPEGYRLVRLEAGGSHFAVLSEDGELWTWGENFSGQLGLGRGFRELRVKDPTYVAVGQPHPDISDPARLSKDYISNSPFTKIKDVALGYQHSLFLQETGTVWVCGKGGKGELGLAERPTEAVVLPRSLQSSNRGSLPPSAPVLGRVRSVAAGQAHSLFLDFDDQVWACGDNKLGCVGVGHFVNQFYPVPVGGPLSGAGVQKVVAGHSHSVVLTKDGRLFAWGSNVANQCTYNFVDNISGFAASATQRSLVLPVRMEVPVVSREAWEAGNDPSSSADGVPDAASLGLPSASTVLDVPGAQTYACDTETLEEVTGYSAGVPATGYLPVDEIFDVVDIQAGFYDSYFRLRDGSLLSLGGGPEGLKGAGAAPVLTHWNPDWRPEDSLKRPELWPYLSIQQATVPPEFRQKLLDGNTRGEIHVQHLSPSFLHTLIVLGSRSGPAKTATESAQ